MVAGMMLTEARDGKEKRETDAEVWVVQVKACERQGLSRRDERKCRWARMSKRKLQQSCVSQARLLRM